MAVCGSYLSRAWAVATLATTRERALAEAVVHGKEVLLPLARMHPDAPVPPPLERPVQRRQPAPLAAYHHQRGEAPTKAVAVLAQPPAATLAAAATITVAVAAAAVLSRPDVRGAKHGMLRAQGAERKVTRVREATHQRRATRYE